VGLARICRIEASRLAAPIVARVAVGETVEHDEVDDLGAPEVRGGRENEGWRGRVERGPSGPGGRARREEEAGEGNRAAGRGHREDRTTVCGVPVTGARDYASALRSSALRLARPRRAPQRRRRPPRASRVALE
jgi:hypothetical protein